MSERQVVLGRMLFAIISGQMLGSVVSGFANVAFGWRSALFIAAGVGAVAAIVAWTRMPAGAAARRRRAAGVVRRALRPRLRQPQGGLAVCRGDARGRALLRRVPVHGRAPAGDHGARRQRDLDRDRHRPRRLRHRRPALRRQRAHAAAPARRAPDVPARLGRRRRLLRRARGRAALVARRRGDALRRPRLLHAAQLDADRGDRARARRPAARPWPSSPAASSSARGSARWCSAACCTRSGRRSRSSSSRWRSSSSAGSWSRASSTGPGRRRSSSAEAGPLRRLAIILRRLQARFLPLPPVPPRRLSPLRITAYTTTTAAGRGKVGTALGPALGPDRAARQRFRPEPAGHLDRPRRRRRVRSRCPGRWPTGTAATTGSPGSASSPTTSSTPPTRRASATARPGSRSCSAPRPRASAPPKTPTARSTARARFPPDNRNPRVHTPHSLTRFVQEALALEGPSVTVSTACSSSAKVFAAAERMLRLGLADAAVVGGVDTLCGSVLFGFNALQLVSPEPCRPFDAGRSGISIGEAAGFALLERAAAARDDGLALLGYGESSDAHHMSTPHPEGLGAERALDDALARAGVDAERDRLHQPARHRQRQERRGRGGAGGAALPGAHPRQSRPRASPATRSAPPASSRPWPACWRSSTASCPAWSTRARSIPPAGRRSGIAAGARRGPAARSAIRSASAATTASLVFGRSARCGHERESEVTALSFRIEGIAFWAPTLPGWDARPRGVPRRGRAGRPAGQAPGARDPGAGRAPARARHASPSRSRWRARPCAPRAATRRRCPRSSPRRTATSRSTTTCARRSRPSRRRSRRPAFTTRCTTPPPATGPSPPAAMRRAAPLTAFDASFAAGLLEAATQCAADDRPVLLVGVRRPGGGRAGERDPKRRPAGGGAGHRSGGARAAAATDRRSRPRSCPGRPVRCRCARRRRGPWPATPWPMPCRSSRRWRSARADALDLPLSRTLALRLAAGA